MTTNKKRYYTVKGVWERGETPHNSTYHVQKSRAKQRGIEWLFTFKSWVQWWEDDLGPDWPEMRGSRRGEYVMARKGDEGPYLPENVDCITTDEHNRQKSTKGMKYNKRYGLTHYNEKPH